MPTLKGSKTEHNLLAAFAGESQARNRYSFLLGILLSRNINARPIVSLT